jgi:hypothetical protein
LRTSHYISSVLVAHNHRLSGSKFNLDNEKRSSKFTLIKYRFRQQPVKLLNFISLCLDMSEISIYFTSP